MDARPPTPLENYSSVACLSRFGNGPGQLRGEITNQRTISAFHHHTYDRLGARRAQQYPAIASQRIFCVLQSIRYQRIGIEVELAGNFDVDENLWIQGCRFGQIAKRPVLCPHSV